MLTSAKQNKIKIITFLLSEIKYNL